MRVGVYCRVSTTNQNIETQLLPPKEYAQRRSFAVVGEYTDTGISGMKDRTLERGETNCFRPTFSERVRPFFSAAPQKECSYYAGASTPKTRYRKLIVMSGKSASVT
jgi:hypothetical protein